MCQMCVLLAQHIFLIKYKFYSPPMIRFISCFDRGHSFTHTWYTVLIAFWFCFCLSYVRTECVGKQFVEFQIRNHADFPYERQEKLKKPPNAVQNNKQGKPHGLISTLNNFLLISLLSYFSFSSSRDGDADADADGGKRTKTRQNF